MAERQMQHVRFSLKIKSSLLILLDCCRLTLTLGLLILTFDIIFSDLLFR